MYNWPHIIFVFVLLLPAFPIKSQWQYIGSPDIGTPVSLDAEGDIFYACAAAGLFYSDNDAHSWISIEIPDSAIFLREVHIENGALFLIAHKVNYGKTLIFRSYDNGENWKDITNSLIIENSFNFFVHEDTIIISFNDSVAISHNKGDKYMVAPADFRAKPFIHHGRLMTVYSYTLYQSSDLGLSWESVYTNPTTLFLDHITSVENVLWKTEVDFQFVNAYVSRSVDDGITWMQMLSVPYDSLHFYSTYVIGGNGSLFLVDISSAEKLFHSTDGGLNWQGKSIPDNTHSPLYHNGILLYSFYRGIYRSPDDGDSFHLANTGFGAASVLRFVKNGEELWINANLSMFKKDDIADTWTLIPNAYSVESTLDGYMFGLIDALPKRSDDGGNTWTTIAPWYFGQYPAFSKFIAAGNIMYGIASSDTWYSSDHGVSWKLSSDRLRTIEYHQQYVASDDFGNVYLSDDGIDWTDITYDLDVFSIFNDIPVQYHHDFVFVSSDNGFYRLFPHSTGWDTLEGPVPNASSFYISPIKTMKSHGDLLIAGLDGHGVFISNDNGDTWLTANEGLTDFQIISSAIIDSDIYLGVEGGVWKRPLSELIISATSDPERKLSISVSPNPVIDFLNITINDEDLAGNIRIALYDSKGGIVKTMTANGLSGLQIYVRDIPSGVYFLKAQTSGKIGVVKIVKQ